MTFAGPAQASQVLEILVNQAVIQSDPDPEALPLETGLKGDIYTASDQTFRGYFKVELVNPKDGRKFGWVAQTLVGPADPAVVEERKRGHRDIDRARYSVGAQFAFQNFHPANLQDHLAIGSTSLAGTSFGISGATRLSKNWTFAISADYFNIPRSGADNANFAWSGTYVGGSFDYEFYRYNPLTFFLSAAGGAALGTLDVLEPGGVTYTVPAILAGYWFPKIGMRWNVGGTWGVYSRLGWMIAADQRVTLGPATVSLNLNSVMFQLGFSIGL